MNGSFETGLHILNVKEVKNMVSYKMNIIKIVSRI